MCRASGPAYCLYPPTREIGSCSPHLGQSCRRPVRAAAGVRSPPGFGSSVSAGGPDRDVRDVRRAAASPEDRHRQWRPERGVLPLCSGIRQGTPEGWPGRRGARDGGNGGEPQLLGQDSSGVAVAIVQSGVASPEEVRRFYALGSLYREPLWVFYRGEKRLDRLGQLEGRRIGVGPPGSGTRRRHAVAGRQRPDRVHDRIRILQEKSSGRPGPGRRRCRGFGLAERRAGCRVLRRRLRGSIHPGPPARQRRETSSF